MFNSAQSILDKFIDTDNVSRFTFYSVEMERGENPEDLFYLCTLKDRYYVVLETDYIMNSLADVAREAADIFKGYDLSPLHWIVKKDSQSLVNTSAVSIDIADADEFRESLVSDRFSSVFGYEVRYAVIEFADAKNRQQHRFHPNTYGSTSR